MAVARRVPGKACPECGFVFEAGSRTSRPVVMEDGSLSELTGSIYPPKIRRDIPKGEKQWMACYFRAKNSSNGMTFKQAEALFFQENGCWPPDTYRYMPVEPRDWYLRVADVPADRLNKGNGFLPENLS